MGFLTVRQTHLLSLLERSKYGDADCLPGSLGNLAREIAFTAVVFDMNMNTLIRHQSHPGLPAQGFHLVPPAPHTSRSTVAAQVNWAAAPRVTSQLKCVLVLLMETENRKAESPRAP